MGAVMGLVAGSFAEVIIGGSTVRSLAFLVATLAARCLAALIAAACCLVVLGLGRVVFYYDGFSMSVVNILSACLGGVPALAGVIVLVLGVCLDDEMTLAGGGVDLVLVLSGIGGSFTWGR